jgi:hypothetical protein
MHIYCDALTFHNSVIGRMYPSIDREERRRQVDLFFLCLRDERQGEKSILCGDQYGLV